MKHPCILNLITKYNQKIISNLNNLTFILILYKRNLVKAYFSKILNLFQKADLEESLYLY